MAGITFFVLLAVRTSFGTAAHTGGKNAGREPWTHVDTRLQNCAGAGQRIFTAESTAAARLLLRGGPVVVFPVAVVGAALALAGVFPVGTTRLVVLPGAVVSKVVVSIVGGRLVSVVIPAATGSLVPVIVSTVGTTGSRRLLPAISSCS